MQTPVSKRTFLSFAVTTTLALALGTGHAADIKERNVKFPIVNAIDHPQGLGVQKFVEVVDKKSGGKIKIKIYPNGNLGGGQQVAAATGWIVPCPSRCRTLCAVRWNALLDRVFFFSWLFLMRKASKMVKNSSKNRFSGS